MNTIAKIPVQLKPASGLQLLRGYVDTGIATWLSSTNGDKCLDIAAVDCNKPLRHEMRFEVQLDAFAEGVHLTLHDDGTWSLEVEMPIKVEGDES